MNETFKALSEPLGLSALLQKQQQSGHGRLNALTLSRWHHGYPAGVRGMAGDPTLCDHSRAVAVLEEAGIRLALL